MIGPLSRAAPAVHPNPAMPDRQRLYRTHAVVLRRRDFGDADRILTVLTPNYGKLELIAKGARKTTSRKAGHLEMFGHSSLLVAKARTWDIITEAVSVESFPALRSDLDKIGQASYLAELVDSFTETGDENLAIWDLLILALQELNALEPGSRSAPLLLHWVQLQLLALAGFQPQLFECLGCDAELEPVTNFLSLSEGGIFCPGCAAARRDVEPIEADVLKVLRFFQTRTWPTVRNVQVRSHILQRVDNLLHRYLLTVLERRLKSVDFLRRLQHMDAPPIRAAAAGAAPALPTAEESA